MHTTSGTLLDRLRNGLDDRAWQNLVHLYTPILYRWAVRAGENEHDAADLVQDVFAVLVDALPEFRRERKGAFRCWLRTITMNKLRDRRRRQNTIRMEQMSADQVPHWPDGAEAFWEQEYSKTIGRRALELMRTDFSPTTWKACWEFVANGRSAAAVAQELGISERAVYLAKFRVISRLRQDLDGLLD
jgi:RNA polymerase sigma-70 factor (ECF subfamily)